MNSSSPAPRARIGRHASIVLAVILAGAAHAETKSAKPASSLFHACDGALGNSSVSIHEDDGRQKWTIKLEGSRCRIDFRTEGKVDFNEDFTEVLGLPRDGSFRLDVTDDGERRQLEITPGPSGLKRTW